MTQVLPSVCDSCLRRISLTKCEAFPREIPADISTWGANHAEPIPGQGNLLTWLFKPGTEAEFEAWKALAETKVR